MSLTKKLIAVDFVPYEYRARELGCRFFPLQEIREIFSRDADIVEILVTLIRKIPENPKDYRNVCELYDGFQSKCHMLENCGAKIIECPTKLIMPSDPSQAPFFKHSDDQRLMITTLMACMKLRPDYLVLFASDGDYTPMVEALRDEGIRTVIVGSGHMLSKDLCRKAVQVIDFDTVVKEALALNDEHDRSLRSAS